MSLAPNIEFLPDGKKYQLILPVPIVNSLGLTDPEGRPVSIIHENKMQLEWLSQRILTRFSQMNDELIVKKSKLKKRKYWMLGIMAMAIVAGLLNAPLAKMLHVSVLYIDVIAFAFGIIACLQTLANLDPEMMEFKELILKDYSL